MSARDLDAHPWLVEESDYPFDGTQDQQIRALLRYGVLAPSTRNTQPWRFRIVGSEVHLFADSTRWLRVCDPHRRELFLSLGCALENLLIAADHFGWDADVSYCPSTLNTDLAAVVRLKRRSGGAPSRIALLFPMIPERCTDHRSYNAEPVPASVLTVLQASCQKSGFYVHVTDDADTKRRVDTLATDADARQFADPDFRSELGECIGHGNFGTFWLLAVVGQLAVSYLNVGESTAKKDHELLMSSPLLGVVSSRGDTPYDWIRCGQVLERLALTATEHGLALQPMSQIVQVEQTRCELATLLPDHGLTPVLPFRIGYPLSYARHSPRRPLDAVLG